MCFSGGVDVTNEMEILQNLPEKLKKLRLNKGWSQGQLGQKLGVNVQAISKYENGHACPPTNMVIKIASIYDVSLDYLLRNKSDLAVSKISNNDLLECIEEIENLSSEDQQVLTTLIEAFIKKTKFEQLAQSN